jgi:DNA adenine methylase
MAAKVPIVGNVNKMKEGICRPFLKWVGGKRSILPELLKRMPEKYGTYHEPFLGGGALFFAFQPKTAVLSDVNAHLITSFIAVRDNTDDVIGHLKILIRNHSKKTFLKARVNLQKELNAAKRGALFIYLNRTCFNGLYRVNKSGSFNVPIGSYSRPETIHEDNLKKCSKILKHTKILNCDFRQMQIQKGDFYYLDPPYHKAYASYDASGFGENDQIVLAEFCETINAKGGYFMLSNSNTLFVRELYKHYSIEVVSGLRSVSCKGNNRGRVDEVIIRNYK